jgi:hypothetical protein
VAEGSEKPKASELLLFFKMRGKATSPEFAPIIESALGRDHALKLKALISAN